MLKDKNRDLKFLILIITVNIVYGNFLLLLRYYTDWLSNLNYLNILLSISILFLFAASLFLVWKKLIIRYKSRKIIKFTFFGFIIFSIFIYFFFGLFSPFNLLGVFLIELFPLYPTLEEVSNVR